MLVTEISGVGAGTMADRNGFLPFVPALSPETIEAHRRKVLGEGNGFLKGPDLNSDWRKILSRQSGDQADSLPEPDLDAIRRFNGIPLTQGSSPSTFGQQLADRQQADRAKALPIETAVLGAGDLASRAFGFMDSLGGSRAIRGLAAGRPRELLSIVAPGLSDQYGLTNPKDIATGEQINQRYGLTDKNSSYPMLKGMVTDSVLSPASLFGIGKVAAGAGRAAASSGLGSAALRGLKDFSKDESTSFSRDFPEFMQGMLGGNRAGVGAVLDAQAAPSQQDFLSSLTSRLGSHGGSLNDSVTAMKLGSLLGKEVGGEVPKSTLRGGLSSPLTSLANAVEMYKELPGGAGYRIVGNKQGRRLAGHGLPSTGEGLPGGSVLPDDLSKQLGLKYDNLIEPPSGMSRNDPEWLNNKTFYHGTGTPGMSAEKIDPMQAGAWGKNLFGRGFYTTSDSGGIPEGYALGRAKQIARDLVELTDNANNEYAFAGDISRNKPALQYLVEKYFDKINRVWDFSSKYEEFPDDDFEPIKTFLHLAGSKRYMESIENPDSIKNLNQYALPLHEVTDNLLGNQRDVSDLVSGLIGNFRHRRTPEEASNFVDLIHDLVPYGITHPHVLAGKAPEPMGYIYQYRPQFSSYPLDLDAPIGNYDFETKLSNRIAAKAIAARGMPFSVGKKQVSENLLQNFYDVAENYGGAPSGELLKRLNSAGQAIVGRNPLNQASGSPPEILIPALRSLGVDAMTHTGGLRTGRDYHQVLIHLDPNRNIYKRSSPGTVQNLSLLRSIPLNLDDDDYQVALGAAASSPIPGVSGVPNTREFKDKLFNASMQLGNIYGYHSPSLQTAGVFQMPELREARQVPFWETVRHERTHSLIDQARKQGRIGDLPLAMRVPANWLDSNIPVVRGFGKVLDETAAQAFGNRDPVRQVMNAANFMFGPGSSAKKLRSAYAPIISKESELANAIFQNLYRGVDPRTYVTAGLGAAPFMSSNQAQASSSR